MKEFKVPVPWGHIAGRESGPEDGHPLLLLHGWMDNCGSFDGLQPLISPDFHCYAVDLPGHGLSSHLPAGAVYSSMLSTMHVRMIREHFGWSRFSIIGHSMGGAVGLLYAALFADEVASLVMLDMPKLRTSARDSHPSTSRQGVLGNLALLRRRLAADNDVKTRTGGTYEQLRDRYLQAVPGLSEQDADVLMLRAVERKPEPGGYVWRHDVRLRAGLLQPMCQQEFETYIEQLRCRLLQINAELGVKISGHIDKDEVQRCCDIYERVCAEYVSVDVCGAHHVHLSHPDRVSPHISKFLSSQFQSTSHL